MKTFALLLALLSAVFTACAELQSAHKSQEFGTYLRELHTVAGPCTRQAGDTAGYLLKTCEYVVKEKIEVTAHPNTWNITKVGDETVEGKSAVAVYFSCCGPGDVAFFDKTTGEVYAYARKRW